GQTIYVRIKKPTDTCFVVKTFKLLTTPAPIAHQLPDMNKCARSATLHDAMITFGSLMYPALNGQSAVIYKVKFYASLDNANNDTNAITNANYLAADGTVIYVRIETATDPGCYSLSTFTVHV